MLPKSQKWNSKIIQYDVSYLLKDAPKIPIGSMYDRFVYHYLPTFGLIFYGKLVGKYASPMDPMGCTL